MQTALSYKHPSHCIATSSSTGLNPRAQNHDRTDVQNRKLRPTIIRGLHLLLRTTTAKQVTVPIRQHKAPLEQHASPALCTAACHKLTRLHCKHHNHLCRSHVNSRLVVYITAGSVQQLTAVLSQHSRLDKLDRTDRHGHTTFVLHVTAASTQARAHKRGATR